MQTSNDLKNLLERIDRRSYPAYKETRGAYRFGDYVLIRRFGRLAAGASGQAGGSGHSGLIALSRCGQEVLERTACTLNPDSGDVLLRLEVGFPANGRTINARELERILDRDGVEALWEEGGGVPFLARPRAQEMFACFNRYRALELTR